MTDGTRVLVTGGSGFIGRSVLPALAARGCVVHTLTRADTASAPARVVEAVREFDPDVVLHLATHFLSAHEPDDITALVRGNVEVGTVLAEAAVAADARLVTIGTAWQHFEGRDYSPVSLYAATKQALTTIVEYYQTVRGLQASEVTLFDTYGPGDVRPKLVPTLLQAALSGARVEMSGGHQLIDLTYVDDVARGIVDVTLDAGASRTCVLRSWSPVSIRDLVTRIEAVTGRGVDVAWGARKARPREMTTDWEFGESPADWRAEIGLDEGLRRTWRTMVERA